MTFYSDVNQQDPLVQDKIYDLEDIYQSIHNILNTEKGERLFYPEFGINLEQYLFELLTPVTEKLIYKEVYDALRIFEPRIEIDNNLSYVQSTEEYHTVYAEIAFSIKGKVSDTYLYQSRISTKQKGNFYEVQ